MGVCVCLGGSVPATVLGSEVAARHFYSACGRLCVRTMLMTDIRQGERVQKSQRLHSEKGEKTRLLSLQDRFSLMCVGVFVCVCARGRKSVCVCQAGAGE